MIEIKVLESVMVRPAGDTPRKRLWLSDLDHLVQGSHIPTTHFYRRPLDVSSSEDFFDAKKLKESLGKVLVTFYPAAGRLARDDKNRFEINCNGEGVLFMVAEADATIDEFGDFAPSEKLMQLVPQVDSTQDISSYPLFLVQVTHFKCGGVSLGIGIHHYVADGPSAMHMINSWADLTRGLGIISLQPFLDRTLLRPREPPAPSFPHVEYQAPPAAVASGNHLADAFQSEPPRAECLQISKDQLDRLKANAPGYTKYEVLAAHVWRCTCKARRVADHEDAKLYVQVDGRARLRPPLPPGFFGNPQFTATPMITVGELTGRPLEYAASVIHEGVARVNDEYMRSALDYLALQPDLAALRRGPHLLKGPNLQVVSWMRMAAYEADFGWGPPLFMGRGIVAWEGQAFLLPSTGDGSLTLAISLQPEHMAIFKSVFYHI